MFQKHLRFFIFLDGEILNGGKKDIPKLTQTIVVGGISRHADVDILLLAHILGVQDEYNKKTDWLKAICFF